jgi:hypothetical protein
VAPAAGAGVDGGGGIRCRVEDGGGMIIGTGADAGADTPVAPPDGRTQECAQLEITKRVTGTPVPSPPPGTTYSVAVYCVPVDIKPTTMPPIDGAGAQQLPEAQTPPFTTTLTFPADGGTQSVFIDRPSDCTVSESPPPGCSLRSIDPEATEVRQATLYGVTVTNNCDPAVEAALAVVQEPRFTG